MERDLTSEEIYCCDCRDPLGVFRKPNTMGAVVCRSCYAAQHERMNAVIKHFRDLLPPDANVHAVHGNVFIDWDSQIPRSQHPSLPDGALMKSQHLSPDVAEHRIVIDMTALEAELGITSSASRPRRTAPPTTAGASWL
jgi:hypothetical protein